ncbi:MAG: hypothetical protein FWC36_02105 [Spirochaetes bacterium]|nr:hypothetical protein [Spirochaetota bacterium]
MSILFVLILVFAVILVVSLNYYSNVKRAEEQKTHKEIAQKTTDSNIEDFKKYLNDSGIEYKVLNKNEYSLSEYYFAEHFEKMEESDKILITIYHVERNQFLLSKSVTKHLKSIIFDENNKIKYSMYNQL